MSRRRITPRGRRGQGAAGSGQRVEAHADGEWVVRRITGSSSTKPYRCPGCDHLIAMATPHVVAWPAQKSIFSDSALDERRHWHSACWSRRR